MIGSWVERGACRVLRESLDPKSVVDVFYPPPGRLGGGSRAICRGCEVQCECALWSLLAEDYGWWAGWSEVDRNRMRADLSEGAVSLADLMAARGCDDQAGQIRTDGDVTVTAKRNGVW